MVPQGYFPPHFRIGSFNALSKMHHTFIVLLEVYSFLSVLMLFLAPRMLFSFSVCPHHTYISENSRDAVPPGSLSQSSLVEILLSQLSSQSMVSLFRNFTFSPFYISPYLRSSMSSLEDKWLWFICYLFPVQSLILHRLYKRMC